jgi:CelD/BcsL family acetyltransferase involved in cellulose biosynthesis
LRSSLDTDRRTLPVAAMDVEDIELSVHAHPGAIEPSWRELECHAVMSVYQRFDWLRPWWTHAARPAGIEPAVVLGTRRGRPLFLLPLARRRTRIGTAVEWMGGSHVNVGVGLFDRELAGALDGTAARRLVGRVLDALAPLDYLCLRNQPEIWQGVANPLRAVASMDDQPVMAIALQPDFRSMLAGPHGARKRKKLRWQENSLSRVGGYRFVRAETADEALRLFSAFQSQKERQFAQSGIHNVFAEAGTAAFFRSLITEAASDGNGLIELFGLEIEGEIRATFATGSFRSRMHGYFSGINLDTYQRVSPGELLLYNVIRNACGRGLEILDLGVGEERYKAAWQPVCERQFVTLLPVTARGRLAAAAWSASHRMRLRVRRNDTAWAAVKKVRRVLGRLGPPSRPRRS